MTRKEGKNRLLTIYDMLINNKVVDKTKMALEFDVNEKTIRRDIEEIKNFLFENIDSFGEVSVDYDRRKEGYILNKSNLEYDQKRSCRKNISFVRKSNLVKIKFQLMGESVEAILNRLQVITILEERGKILLEAKVDKEVVKMWVLSQGNNIKVVEPQELVEEIRKEIQGMYELY